MSKIAMIRDILGLLFTPVVSFLACWLICLFAYGAWSAESEEQRLHYLGAALIVFVLLVGIGGQWVQRIRIQRWKFSGPAGIGGEMEAGDEQSTRVTTETTITTDAEQ